MANRSEFYDIVHPANHMLAAVTGTIGAVGVPGNAFLAFLIVCSYKKRKSYEWLLFALALGDLILCLNNVVLEAPFISRYDLVECKIAGAIDYLFGTVSFLTPPLVAYNRYLTLYNTDKYLKLFTNRNVAYMYAAILAFGTCWITPFIIENSLGQDDLGICGTRLTTMYLSVIMTCVAATVILSYVFLLYLCFKVIAKIRRHKNNNNNANNANNRRNNLLNESKEIITVMLLISIIPLFAQIPAAILKIVHAFTPGPVAGPWVTRSIVMAFPLTSALNAYITIYVVNDYRRFVIELFRLCFKSQNIDVNQPNQPMSVITVSGYKNRQLQLQQQSSSNWQSPISWQSAKGSIYRSSRIFPNDK